MKRRSSSNRAQLDLPLLAREAESSGSSELRSDATSRLNSRASSDTSTLGNCPEPGSWRDNTEVLLYEERRFRKAFDDGRQSAHAQIWEGATAFHGPSS